MTNETKHLEEWILQRIKTASAGYLAALEDTLYELSQVSGSTAWRDYLKQQEELYK